VKTSFKPVLVSLLSASLVLGAGVALAAKPIQSADNFKTWLPTFKARAAKEGISEKTITAAFGDVKYLPRVIELDRKQPESTMNFAKYRKLIVNQTRIKKGRALYKKHKAMLDKIGKKYGVQPRFIVALWGIETNFGANTGSFSVVESLATLAFDGRRSEFFSKELMNALKIIDQGHISAKEMEGSWAGAMGQSQFMPSSFLAYAQDFNNDGKKDIWHTKQDVFASVANYLSSVGWNDDLTWGREVRVPKGFDVAQADRKITKTLQQWQDIGVRNADGSALPDRRALKAAVVMPDGKDGPAYIVYSNYNAIMNWNRSTYFATSVGLLSDAIKR
jgi:membrane-bound lytic murein transglycosylase B